MKPLPQVFSLEGHLGVVDDAVLLWLDGPEGSGHPVAGGAGRAAPGRGDGHRGGGGRLLGGQHFFVGGAGRAGVARQVRQLGQQGARVVRVRAARGEVLRLGQEGADAEVRRPL